MNSVIALSLGTYRDRCLVHRASTRCKKDVHQDRHGDGCDIHAKGRSNQQATPNPGLVVFDILQAHLRPAVREIHEEDETKQQEEHRADESDVVAVDEEERFGNEERHDQKSDPDNHFRTPVSVLQGCSAISRCPDTEKQERHDEMKQPQSEVDPMNSHPTIALFTIASNLHIIKGHMLQFLQRPRCEHDP